MKVLFASRLDVLTVLGGDTIQMLETKAALERLGVEVTIAEEAEPNARGYDLVHIFNTQFPDLGLPQLRAIKRQGVPVALSTVYWDVRAIRRSPDVLAYDLDGVMSKVGSRMPDATGTFLSWAIEFRSGFARKVRQMLVEADVLLPNSVAELEIVVRDFDYVMARSKSFVVVNAVKPTPAEVKLSPKNAELLASLPARFVMESARIESIKGQLQLLRGTARHCPEVPLVFVGGLRPSRYSTAFLKAIERRPNARFLGLIPHEELPAFYARAQVHALPSLRESPGLSTLEAALAGCNCVVGVHAPVQEYFGQDAWICDPIDVDSIGEAVKAAWEAPNEGRLKERIRTEFTWTRAAETTLAAYRFVLGRPR